MFTFVTLSRLWCAQLPDYELAPLILQLVQCLKYENYHNSPLSRFLIRRSLKSPYQIGHTFFWLLKAELHVPQYQERFGLILEEYVAYSQRHAVTTNDPNPKYPICPLGGAPATERRL
jgi:hypothetical protein